MLEASPKSSTRAELGAGQIPHHPDSGVGTGAGQNIIILAITWLYFDVPRNILKAWKNFLLYNLEYFSIPLLLKTLFSHWRRYGYAYPRGFDIKGYLEVFTSNLISRILGAIMRTILIIIGIIAEILIVVGGLIIFLCWLVLPFAAIYGLWRGFTA